MLAKRRKSMKAGGISFGKDGEIVAPVRSKNTSSSFFMGGSCNTSSRSKAASRKSTPAITDSSTNKPSQAPVVPRDHSVGFDMRSAR